MAARKLHIHLWEMGSGLPLADIGAYLKDVCGANVSCPVPRMLVSPDRMRSTARLLVTRRITDDGRLRLSGRKYTLKELNTVIRILEGNATPSELKKTLFSGIGMQTLLSRRLGTNLFGKNTVNLVFTRALPVTWDANDCRYRPRTIVCGFPSIISTTGAIEGPKKPRGLDVARMTGLSEEDALRKYSKKFLDFGDIRMTEIAKGFALQAVFYHLTGDPFCARVDCRLYNARWQEELLGANIPDGRLCDGHARLLREFRGR